MVGHLGQIALVFENNRIWKPWGVTATWPWENENKKQRQRYIIRELYIISFADLLNYNLYFSVSICQHTPASDVCTSLILVDLVLSTHVHVHFYTHALPSSGFAYLRSHFGLQRQGLHRSYSTRCTSASFLTHGLHKTWPGSALTTPFHMCTSESVCCYYCWLI